MPMTPAHICRTAMIAVLLTVTLNPPSVVRAGDMAPPERSVAATSPSSRVLVKPITARDRRTVEDIGRRAGARVVREVPQLGWFVLEVEPGVSEAAVLRSMRSSAKFEKVEVDWQAYPALAPNDPLYPGQWGLSNTGQGGGTPGADIGAEAAWDVSTGATGVVVAIVDTGVDITHPDLAANVWVNDGEVPGNGIDDDGNGYVDDVYGWDFGNRDASVYDDPSIDRHGTHVAGIVGAVGDNGVGVAGVAWDVRLMPCKFIASQTGSVSAAAEAIVYAVDNGADIINNSWSTKQYSGILEDAIAYARRHGVINIAAAGNSGADLDLTPEWPAAIEATNVVTVAATDRNDSLAGFSNLGVNLVDVAAPGVEITSTVPGGYARISGTSMAAPCVSGSLALLKAAHPAEAMDDLRARLDSTVTTLAGLVPKVRTGGRIDLGRAITPHAAAPRILYPAEGAVLEAGSSADIVLSPRSAASASTYYEAQVGTPVEYASNVGFEDGTLDGWATGTYPFIVATRADEVFVGDYAARSAQIGHSQATYIQTTVDVPAGGAWLHFRYLLDSEDFYDYASLAVNGSVRWQARSDAEWAPVRLWLKQGTNQLRWIYYKNASGTEGRDMFALDEVRVTTHEWGPSAFGATGSAEISVTVPGAETRSGALRVRGIDDGGPGAWERVDGLVFREDVTPPSAPTALSAAPYDDGEAVLSWTDPPDEDWALTRLVRSYEATPASPLDGLIVYEGRDGEYHDAGLQDGTTAYYTAFARDESRNWSTGASTSVVAIDTVAPPPVGALAAVQQGQTVAVSWQAPASRDVASVRVTRRGDAAPAGPDDPLAALVYEGTDGQVLDSTPAVEPTETVLYYGAWTRDNSWNWSVASTVSVEVDTLPPPAPTGFAVTGVGRDWASFEWDAAGDDDVEGHALWRRLKGSSTWVRVAAEPYPGAAVRDASVLWGKEYSYRLTAYDASGNHSVPSVTQVVVGGVASQRLAGADRYGTAVEVSRDTFDSAQTVVLATGESYADALGASSYAGVLRAPVLLTRARSLPAEVRGEIERLGASRVVIVGGPRAIGEDVESALREAGLAVDRVAGEDRYETAALAARRTIGERAGSAAPGTVFVVRGDEFADALAVAPVAYAGRIPVLLVKRTGVPAATRQVIGETGAVRAVVAGGVAAVPEEVRQALGVPSRRVSGAERYETAAAFASWAADSGISSFAHVGLATGRAFPDALGGGAALGAQGGVLLLSSSATLPAAARDGLSARRDIIESLRVLGGDSALSSAVMDEAIGAVR